MLPKQQSLALSLVMLLTTGPQTTNNKILNIVPI